MRVGVLILFYNVNRFIRHTLDNCGPLVDAIYISYSAKPWSHYNTAARGFFENKSQPAQIQSHPHYGKCRLIEGEWATEAEQRNAALERARADGMDFLIVQDADEYYHQADYQMNIDFLAAHRNELYFRGMWYTFWKTTDYVVETAGVGLLTNCENFAVNCRLPVEFVRNRRVGVPADYQAMTVPGVCFHLSYVYSDSEVWEKINTWGHADQVDRANWYRRKWLCWSEQSRCLSPIAPEALFRRALRFRAALPECLASFSNPAINAMRASRWERIWWPVADCWAALKFDLRRALVRAYSALRGLSGWKPDYGRETGRPAATGRRKGDPL